MSAIHFVVLGAAAPVLWRNAQIAKQMRQAVDPRNVWVMSSIHVSTNLTIALLERLPIHMSSAPVVFIGNHDYAGDFAFLDAFYLPTIR
jgi:hypothetical protein